MDVDKWIETLKGVGCLHERDVRRLCESVKEIFIEESDV